MMLPLLAILAGLVILTLGADRFVGGAASLARRFGLPSLLIGMVIIGFGTSMPEILVSSTAAFQGTSGIALGNAFGSNITNILLIIGVCALIKPISVTAAAIKREIPILLVVTALVWFLLSDGVLTRLNAAIMLIAFAVCMATSVYRAFRPSDPQEAADEMITASEIDAQAPTREMSAGLAAVWVVVGLVCMLGSSRLLVWGAVTVARHFGVSDLVIGLTVVAVGTSLPELASSVMAARKGEDDMALGNIIGSNTFNSLLVVGLAGLIHPLTAESDFLTRDMPITAAATVLLFTFCWGRNGKGVVTRFEGAILLLGYIAYTSYLIFTSTSGAAMPGA